MLVIIPIILWQNHVWDIVSQKSCFGRKKFKFRVKIHFQVTNHNPWYLIIGKSIVCNSKPLFYHSVIPIWLRNVILWICIINFYSHIIAHFINNWFKPAITFNESHSMSLTENADFCNISLLHPKPCSTLLLLYWKVGLILETICICQLLWKTTVDWWT